MHVSLFIMGHSSVLFVWSCYSFNVSCFFLVSLFSFLLLYFCVHQLHYLFQPRSFVPYRFVSVHCLFRALCLCTCIWSYCTYLPALVLKTTCFEIKISEDHPLPLSAFGLFPCVPGYQLLHNTLGCNTWFKSSEHPVRVHCANQVPD